MNIYRNQHLSYPGLPFSMEWEGEEASGDRPGLGNFPSTYSGAPQGCLAPACTAGIEVVLASNGLHGLDPTANLTLNHSNTYANFDHNILSSSGHHQNPYVCGQDLLPSQYPTHARGAYPSVRQFENALENVYQRPSPISDYEDVPAKLEDDANFSHLHHPTPAYLPPNSFLLSPIPTHRNIFPVDNSLNNTHPIDMPEQMEHEAEELTEDDEEPFLSPRQTSDLAPSSQVDDEDYLPDLSEDVGKMDSQNKQYHQHQHRQEELSRQQNSLNIAVADPDDDAPYAVLIYRALMSTPTRRMVLSQIYDYFREKIPKFRKIKGRGWMNSIRHNLSMNGAFLKEDRPPEDPGKGYIWVLSKEAEVDGVKSTTRYRKSPPNAKKRATDEFYLRGSTVKRRRKSTRKGAASKPASSPCPSESTGQIAEQDGSESQQAHEQQSMDSPPLPEGFFKREDTDTQPAGMHVFNDQDHPGLAAIYANEERMLLTQATRASVAVQQVDYSNCYSSFPHDGTSETLYNSEDEGFDSLEEDCWQFCLNNDGTTDGNSDNFSEEFTLVTQK